MCVGQPPGLALFSGGFESIKLKTFFRESVMDIEWERVERAGGAYADWLAVVEGPDGTEIAADYGPIIGQNKGIAYQVAWRRKTPAGQTATSQLTLQVVVEGYVVSETVAKATCERLMDCLQQIAQDSPGMLQTLQLAAT